MDISTNTTESLIQSYKQTEQEVAKFRQIYKQLEESLLHAPNIQDSNASSSKSTSAVASKCSVKSTQSTVNSKSSRSTPVIRNSDSNLVKRRIQHLEDYKNLVQQQQSRTQSSVKQCFLDSLNK